MPDDLQLQIPYIRKFVEASNILMLEEHGVEADDIIASAVKFFTASAIGWCLFPATRISCSW